MIGLDEISQAAADSTVAFDSAAGIDHEALVNWALTLHDGAEKRFGELLAEGKPFRVVLISSLVAAWTQAFGAGVIAARVEAGS